MLTREIGSTFSDSWHRVAGTRPRLSPHAHVVQQEFGGHTAYIVEEPAGGSYYRLSEPAYFFLGLLDGRRTVDEAWDAANSQRGDDAPTQKECIELLGRLQLYGLLLGDLPLAPDMVVERSRAIGAARLERRTGKWIFLSVPLWNPEPFLERHRRAVEWIFSRWGALLWFIVGAVALWRVLSVWPERRDSALNLVGMLDQSNLVALGVAFVVMRALHELGHAAACKALGGRVTEIGVTLIVYVLPIPYCDATSSWKFQRTQDRVLVGAAGVIVEMFFAAIAAIVWSYAEPGGVRTVCYDVMILSSVTTAFFNLNPLLRYDGYYILSDLVGSPNLSPRAKQLWSAMLHRWVFGVRTVRAPEVRGSGEAWILGVFGALSGPYRVFIMSMIIILIASKYLTFGLVLALVVLSVWAVWPLLKAIGYMVSAPELMGHRTRALGAVAGLGLLLVIALGLVPARASAYAAGTVEPVVEAPVRTGEDGFLTTVVVGAGQAVTKDQPLFVLESPENRAELARAEARLKKAQAEFDRAITGSPAEEEVSRLAVERARAERDRAAERAAALTVRSPAAGVMVPPTSALEPENLAGRYFARGVMLGTVVSPDDLVVRVLVSDKEAAYLFHRMQDAHHDPDHPEAYVRVRGEGGTSVPARIVRIVPAGSRDMAKSSLSTATGGDITPDPDDTSGRKSLVPQFVIEVKAEDGAHADRTTARWVPGLRARVRFALPREPLFDQWWRKASQYLQGRLG